MEPTTSDVIERAMRLQQAIAGSRATIQRLVEEAQEDLGVSAQADTLEFELNRLLEAERENLRQIQERLEENTKKLAALLEEIER